MAMRFLVMGALNYDHVYGMKHIVAPKETAASLRLETACGGKGLNQSIALAKAGAAVWHGGMVGEDGALLVETAAGYGVCTDFIRTVPGRSGHAVIQVDQEGQNAIVLYGGSNQCLTKAYMQETLLAFGRGDCLVLQNEVNMGGEILAQGAARGMEVALNPSPFGTEILNWDLSKVSLFFLNEVEGEQMTGKQEPEEMVSALCARYPAATVVLTLGEKGAMYADRERKFFCPAVLVRAVDTTAAGDTFTGYFLAARAKGFSPEQCMRTAAQASALAVSRQGAAPSIPVWEEVARMAEKSGGSIVENGEILR